MIFNSIDFLIFLPIVFILYWIALKDKVKEQNILIVIASYVFYGWWDYRFLALIAFSTVLDYIVGNKIGEIDNKKVKKRLLMVSLISNLGLLFFFKYFNFFVDSFVSSFTVLGYSIDSPSLDIILPVGISFYTFQTLSYTIDVYRGNLKPTKDIVAFSAFVSFFPQLVAGPIERASHLLPQFYAKREFNSAVAIDGLRQILWGAIKKVVVADSCAKYANLIFNNYTEYDGYSLFLGGFFFALQIYGDFSGYSDMAIGLSRLFGFDLMTNFRFPYFSRDISEFWRRWHISLSTWFRDYLYIPLGGSKGTKNQQIRNVFIIFLVSGFWHGANWTFVFWGGINALYFLPALLRGKNRRYLAFDTSKRDWGTKLMENFRILKTFFLAVVAWVFFRSEDISKAFGYLKSMFIGFASKESLIKMVNMIYWDIDISLVFSIILFVIIEWLGRMDEFAIQKIGLSWPRFIRYTFYYLLILSVFWLGAEEQEFIYFQF